MDKLPYEKINRKIIYKQKQKIASKPYEYTSEEMFNCGLVNLDKPKGPICRKVVRKLKGVLELAKAGHAGTLEFLSI